MDAPVEVLLSIFCDVIATSRMKRLPKILRVGRFLNSLLTIFPVLVPRSYLPAFLRPQIIAFYSGISKLLVLRTTKTWRHL